MFWIKTLLVLAFLGIGVISSWGLTDHTLHLTSTQAFCGSCHSMKPMQASFLRDTHGGNSTTGIQALCTDCHLPHDSTINYLWVKARSGAWDIWKEFVLGAEDVDWHAKRARANTYVYDSGCIKCHNNLQSGSGLDPAQFVAHKPYFLGTIKDSCIDCHSVGHADLSRELPPPPTAAITE
ncbi:cytochrome c3 family protein [Marinobacterium sediminicola]|uniref:Cytochrome c-type protein n=1 Tax=Marinobacterium sediminicola TaxID=518898 RepID=A0ABY1S1P7_9GAMM|nr:NapC/NirT family cytochrome c [Marinobacterium sediminicola]ULG69816.1 NapC/NirT family cytochrome c [Marinobacterium sediminicola]SMR75370.1 NapC/NirT cytochrome c family, N-terminal region [Marinobacterium sediminicola]